MAKTAAQIEEEKLGKRIWGRFHEACEEYQLLENGDKILVGLSGGKDSLALVELLGRQAKIFVPKIEVKAVHVRIRQRNYLSDTQYLENFCREQGMELIIRDEELGEKDNLSDPDSENPTGKEKNPCFVCSWYRRKAMLNLAQELGCNKIALGHHRDDVLETLMMNLIFQGRFSSIPPKLPLDKMPLSWIRPLCYIDEKDLQRYAELRKYRKQIVNCQFEKDSSRTYAKTLIREWEKINPDVKSSLERAMKMCGSPQN